MSWVHRMVDLSNADEATIRDIRAAAALVESWRQPTIYEPAEGVDPEWWAEIVEDRRESRARGKQTL